MRTLVSEVGTPIARDRSTDRTRREHPEVVTPVARGGYTRRARREHPLCEVGSTSRARWLHPSREAGAPVPRGGSTRRARWLHSPARWNTRHARWNTRHARWDTRRARWLHQSREVAALVARCGYPSREVRTPVTRGGHPGAESSERVPPSEAATCGVSVAHGTVTSSTVSPSPGPMVYVVRRVVRSSFTTILAEGGRSSRQTRSLSGA